MRIDLTHLEVHRLPNILQDVGDGSALLRKLEHPALRLKPRLWMIRGGMVSPLGKVGRNDACPCGSGMKHKRCCM